MKQAKGIGPKTAQRVVNELARKGTGNNGMAAAFGQSAVEKQEPISKDSKEMQIYIPRARWPINWKEVLRLQKKAGLPKLYQL